MRLIDADALIEVLGIAENCSDCQYQNGPLCDKNDCFVDACEAIFDMPTIDPVKHGKWIKAERQGCWSYADVYKQCSECGKVTFLAEKMNYCPNCGADMRGETGC